MVVLVISGLWWVCSGPSDSSPTRGADTGAGVREGCRAAIVLKDMVIRMDVDGLDRSGPRLMRSMVTTDDGVLNLTGKLLARKMGDFSDSLSPTDMNEMLNFFDAYISTCNELGR